MSERLWVRVTAGANIPDGEGRAVTVAGRDLALFNLGPSTEPGAGARFVAMANRCPHRGGPLCDGIVAGTSVVCPLHGWKVSLASGQVERPAAEGVRCVETFPVRVHDGVISVGLSPVAGSDTPEGAAA